MASSQRFDARSRRATPGTGRRGGAACYAAPFVVSATGIGMKYRDLRDFIATLEEQGELVRVTAEVDPYLEITEICDRTLRAGGPALLFENVKGHDMPLLGNLDRKSTRLNSSHVRISYAVFCL